MPDSFFCASSHVVLGSASPAVAGGLCLAAAPCDTRRDGERSQISASETQIQGAQGLAFDGGSSPRPYAFRTRYPLRAAHSLGTGPPTFQALWEARQAGPGSNERS